MKKAIEMNPGDQERNFHTGKVRRIEVTAWYCQSHPWNTKQLETIQSSRRNRVSVAGAKQEVVGALESKKGSGLSCG